MAEINEEFIAEFSRVLGNAFVAVNQGIGDENTPGSAIFNLNQLMNLAEKKVPVFGIVQTNDTSGFQVSVDENDANFIKISSGKIAYFNNYLNVTAQRLSIKKTFASTYSTTTVYGMRVGFPISEAQKATNTIWSSVLTENYSIGESVVYIDNAQRIIDLGFPITGYIGINTYVVFDAATDDKKGLIINSAISLGQSFDKGTGINFIYEPKIKSLFGLPVAVVSHDPSAFKYFPPLPSDWLHIADVLLVNPSAPEVDTFGSDPAILRKAIDYPSSNIDPPLFSQSDSQTIARYSEVAKSQLENNKTRASISDSIKALEYYTTALQQSSGLTFRQFWASRPLAKSTYFNKGVNYEGLERFEFSDNFADAYYSLTGRDLNRTFAIYRGDLNSNPSPIYGSKPDPIYGTSISDVKGVSSTLYNGTYFYGVSAVLVTGEAKETPTNYVSIVTQSNKPNYINSIHWSAVPNAQFYHIYRKSSQSGEQIEYRLTEPNLIKGAGPFTNTPITNNDTINLTTTGVAFKITPTGSTEMHLGGFLMKMNLSSSSITNLSDYVSFQLYTNSTTGVPDVLITGASFDNVTFEEISRSNAGILNNQEKQIVLKTNYKMSQGTAYWMKLLLNNLPSSGNVQLAVSNSSATALFATYSGTTWAKVNNVTPFYRLLGFVDNGLAGTPAASRGLYLTKKITREPRRLRIYLPELSATGYPIYGPNANITETKLTKNEMVVTVIAQLGQNDAVTLPAVTIPQGTKRDSTFLLGTDTQIFDRVIDVQVVPGTNITIGDSNSILWSRYDTFIVENVP